MAVRDLIPWSRNQELAPARGTQDPFMTLHREMNRLFDFSWPSRDSGLFSGWSPALDVSDDRDALFVKVELPGMKKEDIKVEVTDGYLTIFIRFLRFFYRQHHEIFVCHTNSKLIKIVNY